MRIAFVVNDWRHVGAEQTTTLLMSAALSRGHRVFVCGVADLTYTASSELLAAGCVLEAGTTSELVSQLSGGVAQTESLESQDLCVVRTNPARDESRLSQHTAMLRLLEGADGRDLQVVNSPRGLVRSRTKLSLLDLPEELRPQTLVTSDAKAIERFVAALPSRSRVQDEHIAPSRSLERLDDRARRQRRDKPLDCRGVTRHERLGPKLFWQVEQ